MRKALMRPPSESNRSPRLSPNEHLKLLVEILRPESVELSRRWLAALLLVPEEDRAALVAEIERRIVHTYADAEEEVEVHVVSPPVQREGYVEQVHTTYTVRRDEQEDTERRQDAAGTG